jgi:hypothetical protein
LARNQDSESRWIDMFTSDMLFHCDSTIKIQLS